MALSTISRKMTSSSAVQFFFSRQPNFPLSRNTAFLLLTRTRGLVPSLHFLGEVLVFFGKGLASLLESSSANDGLTLDESDGTSLLEEEDELGEGRFDILRVLLGTDEVG
jgi:hypothetical protein